jgi:hypothetical protein
VAKSGHSRGVGLSAKPNLAILSILKTADKEDGHLGKRGYPPMRKITIRPFGLPR